ncbi:MAG TPA: radical SAM protein, partial [Pedomonas sp.]|nr:radical SAM protein [Pedomonas sp.]
MTTAIRTDWTREEIHALFDRPFLDLVYEAQTIHRQHHAANTVQLSQLLSIKTGGCAEDCAYCPQSAKFAKETGLKADKLMDVDVVLEQARAAKEAGASRFCMGAAWTRPKDRDIEAISQMIEGVKDLGLEACVTLGMLEAHQAQKLKEAGLDYYNHNIDTSPEHYKEIISTRSFDDRLETLANVREAGIN